VLHLRNTVVKKYSI